MQVTQLQRNAKKKGSLKPAVDSNLNWTCVCRQPVVECDDASKYQRLNLEPHCEADRMCKFFKLRSHNEIMVKKYTAAGDHVVVVVLGLLHLLPDHFWSLSTECLIKADIQWCIPLIDVCVFCPAAHRPSSPYSPDTHHALRRVRQYRTLLTEGWSLFFFPEGSSQKIRSCKNHWWCLAYSFMLICLFSAVQSTSVCGEDIQHAH